MNILNLIGCLMPIVLIGFSAKAQTSTLNSQINKWESSAFTYGEFKAGYGVNQFSTGLSQRFENGNFSTSAGGLASIAAYRKFEKLHYLHFGLTHLQKQQQLDLMEIIEDRHARHATIIVSQLPVASWFDIIGEATIADAILDRLVHTSHRIQLKGESLRKKQ
jgi:hypothetical protein